MSMIENGKKMTMNRATINRLLALLGLGLACASPAAAFDGPDNFRGARWGASPAEIGLGSSCIRWSSAEDRRIYGEKFCGKAITLGGVAVGADYHFRGDRFVGVTLQFDSNDFARMATMFVERYGKPTSDAQTPFKTRGGLSTKNQVLKWDGPNVSVSLKRYGDKITRGSADIVTQAEIQERARGFAETAKEGAKDL